MSKNYYSEIHLHITWHTKGSLPLLKSDVEATAHRAIRRRLEATPGVICHAVGGIETHVHVCATVPPTLAISEFIGHLKGSSSYEVNHTNSARDKRLEWQTGYGVVSFGTKDLQWVKNYVEHQREHHAKQSIHDRLERITELESASFVKAP